MWYPKDKKTFPHHLEEDHVEVEAEAPHPSMAINGNQWQPMAEIEAEAPHPSLLPQLQCGDSLAAGPPPPRPYAAVSRTRHATAAAASSASARGAAAFSSASASRAAFHVKHEHEQEQEQQQQQQQQQQQEGLGGACGGERAEGAVLPAGTCVLARYLASLPKAKRRKKAGANRFYPGVVSHYDEEGGTYTIAYDDGEVESGVLPKHVVAKDDSDDEDDDGDDDDGEDEDEEHDESAHARAHAPRPGSLRLDALVALHALSGGSQQQHPRPVERGTIVQHAYEHGGASTRGDNDPQVHRADMVTVLGRELHMACPLWSQEGSRYVLTAAGRAVALEGEKKEEEEEGVHRKRKRRV